MTHSEQLFQEAVHYIPGGVNSPVRAFGAVGETPRFIRRAEGSRLYDVDGRVYTDYVCSWGAMLLGHNPPAVKKAVLEAVQNGLSFGAATEAEVKMAKLITKLVPSVEMVRMVNSGTEAVMSAIRAARGFTGRDKVIKFAGCYHGHSDSMLAKAGSGGITTGVPDSAGVPQGCATDTLLAQYNDLNSVERLFQQNKGQIAALIVEPVAVNMGVVEPAEGFLSGLRQICSQNGTVLIFDEVITGFRLAPGGAQEYYGIAADLTVFGKIIGAGMPVGAYGGKREIMSQVAPAGPVYQAGTLSGNPVAMAAGLAQLGQIQSQPLLYQKLTREGEKLREGLRSLFPQYTVTGVGSFSCLFFTQEPVTDYSSAQKSDTQLFARFFSHMLNNGIYMAPSQFEAMFLSSAHTDNDIDCFLETAKEFLL
ncbi:glutamate-1-semialdehyde 2,1-aminomutase [Clostridium minihomine]|uniref:glutamate-1-semialdehyde 2,1-aminomutase n=1 Tax=Clostridium minihomine TaxID=2045012 RepID=UPI000C762DAC|nr:glutamate-1-semialdehyde 2,1-aminomutase [Clostridium minihomine]